MADLPRHRRLPQEVPAWVKEGSLYFVTICSAPRGQNQLYLSHAGPKLLESAAHYHQMQRWWVRLFLLMTDHLHVLLAVPKAESLPTVVRVWKSYQAKTQGICWQAGFFDHRLRSDETEEAKLAYVRMNPVRAGLAVKLEDWLYFSPRD